MVRTDEGVASTPRPVIGTEAFAATDWLLLTATALMWGSSFV